MSGSLRFESTSASSEELLYANSGYANGHRGNYLGSSLGRSGSFRESNENRVFSSGNVSRGHAATITGELPPLSQFLSLEPFTICGHKFNWSGEVKRVLGLSYGSVTEDDPLGAIHAKSSSIVVAQDDLKRFKASVADTSLKARGRTKKLIELLHKLNKYYDGMNSRKYQRNEFLTNENSGGPTLPKIGAQMQRNVQEDRSKNVNLNKRVRTAITDPRSDSRNSALSRQNPLKENSPGSDIPDEKIHKTPAGGEGWDRMVKRKRSAGAAFVRSNEDNTELNRSLAQKLNSESIFQPCNAQGGRSGPSSCTSSMKEGFSVGTNARVMVKNEPEKVSLLRDGTPGLCKERVVTKGDRNKLNIYEDKHAMSSSPVMKGKSSRTPRTGPVIVASSSPNSSLPGATEGWEKPSGINKFQSVSGNNSRKKPILSGSTPSPMAQWVGQRPQKIQRNRRANLISPVSNHDDMQTSSEGCSLDNGGRTNSSATNGSAHLKSVSNSLKRTKVKHEIVSSPGLFSESEESGADDDKIEEMRNTDAKLDGNLLIGSQQTGSSSQPMKKNKLHLKYDNSDGVRGQGRSGRGSLTPRSIASPISEKLENATKPVRNARPGYDKSGSKSGRPPIKKSSERSKFTRLGKIPNGSSPDCTGDSDDDRGELLAVAEFICNSSSVMCPNSFWKQMERVFGSVRSGNEDGSYLEQELKSSEQLHDDLRQMLMCGDNILENGVHDQAYVHQILFSEEEEDRNVSSDLTVMSAQAADVADKLQDTTISKGKHKDFPPLYQRLLSALIVEDESVEFDEAYGESDFPSSLDHGKDDIDFEYDAISGLQMRKRSVPSTCNGNHTYNQGAGADNNLCNGKLLQENYGDMYQANEDTPACINMLGMPAFDCPYDNMQLEERLLLELHSIGLYLDTAPDLLEDDEAINDEFFAIKKGLYKLADKKRMHLRKACEAIQAEKEKEGRYLEQLAMDKLTEVAFTKLLATRGSSSSKSGPSKISRHIALAFIKRTLARCRKFETSGKSCFGDPPIRDILAASPCMNGADPSHNVRSGYVPNRGDLHGSIETLSDPALGRNNPMFNPGKRKEALLDDVGSTLPVRASTALGSQLSGGGAKGKRSERDRDARNNSAKNGQPLSGSCSKGERQPKSKPKQKSSQHPTSAFPGRSVHNTGNGGPSEVDANRKRNTGPSYLANESAEPKRNSKGQMDLSNLPLNDLDSIEDLGVSTALDDHQDLDTWLNFDDVVLPEHDALDTLDLSGLEIPMDDLSDLNMIL